MIKKVLTIADSDCRGSTGIQLCLEELSNYLEALWIPSFRTQKIISSSVSMCMRFAMER